MPHTKLNGYTAEKNVQILIYLLKAHNIKTIIASPGTANAAFVFSAQNDPFFKIYSAIDERSAAYMACGMAAESGEPIVISCTGATAARNYLPGLTEAYYSKLPIIAINSVRTFTKIGQLVGQVLDQTIIPKDVARLNVLLPIVKDEEDIFDCEIKINKALLEVKRKNRGPVHIVIPSVFDKKFIPILPTYRAIFRIFKQDDFPVLNGTVAVLVGSHIKWTSTLTNSLEKFALVNNAPVFCEHISGYTGKNRLFISLAATQTEFDAENYQPDILIHIGETFADYSHLLFSGKKIWRVSEDGEIKDTFKKLQYVFEMAEIEFFEYYTSQPSKNKKNYFSRFKKLIQHVSDTDINFPFSNIWLATKIAPQLPHHSTIYLGMLNTLRSWNLCFVHPAIRVLANVGGMGIDGCLSALIGASLLNPSKLYFAFLGDLSFFYEMNILGNRHIGNNVRILIINNGLGMEFKNFNHHAIIFGNQADDYISAKGHYGKQSPNLIKHYAEDLGFLYLSASTKEEGEICINEFLHPKNPKKSIIFEAFTKPENENKALKLASQIMKSKNHSTPNVEAKNRLRYN